MNGNSAVVIVDTGGANLASLQHALQRLGSASQVTADGKLIAAAKHVILPGVGAASDAMQRLENVNLLKVLQELQQPVLGICLGMQLLASHSEEDDVQCLGILPESVKQLPASAATPVPHMGWNRLTRLKSSALLAGVPDDAYFYFIHSFALKTGQSCVASTDYGVEFAAVSEHRNFYATQFHPERSSEFGALVLKNFLALG